MHRLVFMVSYQISTMSHKRGKNDWPGYFIPIWHTWLFLSLLRFSKSKRCRGIIKEVASETAIHRRWFKLWTRRRWVRLFTETGNRGSKLTKGRSVHGFQHLHREKDGWVWKTTGRGSWQRISHQRRKWSFQRFGFAQTRPTTTRTQAISSWWWETRCRKISWEM